LAGMKANPLYQVKYIGDKLAAFAFCIFP
jgi:hypothetical protein